MISILNMKTISLILATTFEGGIGYNNKLPWNYKSELKKFKEITTNTENNLKQNAVIMGSKTYYSLPNNNLPNRINIVLSRINNSNNENYDKHNIKVYNKILDAIEYCNNNDFIENIFIIGGTEIFNYFLNNINLIDNIYLTLIKNIYECDKYINIKLIYKNFKFIKHDKYNKDIEHYVSYICKNYNNI